MFSPIPNIVFLVTVCNFFVLCYTLEEDMTISVDPGYEECFYQSLQSGEVLDIDYQVIDGGQGELDISFTLTAPGGQLIVSDYKKSDNNHRHEADLSGDYRLCFDNRFSSFNSKTVFFEIIVEAEDEKDPWGDLGVNLAEENYEITIQDIEEAVNRVKVHLVKIRHMQEAVRAVEARDRNIAEGNYLRVNYWSIIQILVMLVVGFVQVVMLKSLFDDQSKVHKIWKKVFSQYR